MGPCKHVFVWTSGVPCPNQRSEREHLIGGPDVEEYRYRAPAGDDETD